MDRLRKLVVFTLGKPGTELENPCGSIEIGVVPPVFEKKKRPVNLLLSVCRKSALVTNWFSVKGATSVKGCDPATSAGAAGFTLDGVGMRNDPSGSFI